MTEDMVRMSAKKYLGLARIEKAYWGHQCLLVQKLLPGTCRSELVCLEAIMQILAKFA